MNPAMGEQTSLNWRKLRAGQRLIVGFSGSSPGPEFREFVAQARPAGFILFARNVEDPAQVAELNRELTSLLPDRYPPIISVDQEGGRVQRVRATRWPAARWVGNVNDLQLSYQLGLSMADELLAMGFNVNFAPDFDVDSNPKNPVIGDRAFSASPRDVARHATTVLRAFHEAGLVGCAKHFPGHGDTIIDSHHALPVVEKELPELREVELAPFRAAIAAQVAMIMTAHVVFPDLDPDLPATMSRRIIQGLLRDELGYQGVVVSDDMEMKAVRGRYPLEMQLDLATRASVDLFLVCHELDLCWQSYETLVKLQEEDKAHDRLAEDSERRLLALRERFWIDRSDPPDLSVVGAVAHHALALRFKAEGAA